MVFNAYLQKSLINFLRYCFYYTKCSFQRKQIGVWNGDIIKKGSDINGTLSIYLHKKILVDIATIFPSPCISSIYAATKRKSKQIMQS